MSKKLLSHDLFGTGSKNAAVWLHGILGHKKNLRTISQKLLANHPTLLDSSMTIEHRGHGNNLSSSFQSPHTVQACAQDLSNLITDLDIKPQVMIAHSFGGKVILEYLKLILESNDNIDNINKNINLPENIWILDSLPGPYNDSGNEASVSNVLEILQKLPRKFESRKWMISQLTERYQIPQPIALWLGTSVIPSIESPGQYTWMFDLDIVLELFNDFLYLDLFPWLEYYAYISQNNNNDNDIKLPRIHYLRASLSDQWTPDVITRLEKLNSLKLIDNKQSRVTLQTLKGAGHWLHTSHPKEVLNFISKAI